MRPPALEPVPGMGLWRRLPSLVNILWTTWRYPHYWPLLHLFIFYFIFVSVSFLELATYSVDSSSTKQQQLVSANITCSWRDSVWDGCSFKTTCRVVSSPCDPCLNHMRPHTAFYLQGFSFPVYHSALHQIGGNCHSVFRCSRAGLQGKWMLSRLLEISITVCVTA